MFSYFSLNWIQLKHDLINFNIFFSPKEINLECVLINHLAEVKLCIKWISWQSGALNRNRSQPARFVHSTTWYLSDALERRNCFPVDFEEIIASLVVLWLFHNILTSNRTGWERQTRRRNNDWMKRQWLFAKRQHAWTRTDLKPAEEEESSF